jgi:WD40 repeat protein
VGGAVPPLTGADVDALGRRLIVCDAAAEVHVLDMSTGRSLFSYKAHTAEVMGVALCHHLGLIVSVSSDRSVTLHADAPAPAGGAPINASGTSGGVCNSNAASGACKPRRHDTLHHTDITCSALTPSGARWCRPGARLVTGSEDGALHFWDLDARMGLHLVARLGESKKAPAAGMTSESAHVAHSCAVTAVAFFGTYPILASADVSGRVHLWYVGGRVNQPAGAPSPCRRLLTLLCAGRGENRYPPLESPPWQPEACVPEANAYFGPGLGRAGTSCLSHPTLGDGSEPPPGFFVTEVESLSGAEEGVFVATALASAEIGAESAHAELDGGRCPESFLPHPADCGATGLAFLAEPARLLIGDELGRISSWDVSEIVAAVQEEQDIPAALREEQDAQTEGWSLPGSPHAGVSASGMAPKESPRSPRVGEPGCTASSSADAGAARLAGARVRLVNVWQAHPTEAALRQVAEEPGAASSSLAVIALTPIPPCGAVLSCGADGMARVWAADGAPLGRLQRGKAKAANDSWKLRVCAQAAEAAAAEADSEVQDLRAALLSEELLRSRANVDARRPRPKPKPPELMSEKAAAALRLLNSTPRGGSPPQAARPALLEDFGIVRKPDPAGQRALAARLSQPSPRRPGVAARSLFGSPRAGDDTQSAADAAAARLQQLGVDMYNHRPPVACRR